MTTRPVRIGVIGYGYVGRHLVDSILRRPADLALAFVSTRDRSKLLDLPEDVVARSPSEARTFSPSLIVECAHPDISHRYGAEFLAFSDYMPLSVNALADANVEASLREAATRSGRRLFIPHGALIGLDNLVETRDEWTDVTITFRKHPDNVDFAASGIDRSQIRERRVLYDGPVRGIASLFPRNVNTMATCALATVGLDRCRAVLEVDPDLDVAVAEVRAVAKDGSIHESKKQQKMQGVSGTEMLASQLGSVLRATGVHPTGVVFV